MDRWVTLAKRWTADILPELNRRFAPRAAGLASGSESWLREWTRPELLRELALLALIVVVPGGLPIALSLCAFQRSKRALASAREPT
jgi:hypothetical protein